MTKPELDEAKRLAEKIQDAYRRANTHNVNEVDAAICLAEAFIHQSQELENITKKLAEVSGWLSDKNQELERLREIISGFLYNFECDKECQCCNYNNGQIDELRNYALEKQIQCNTD